MAFELRVLKRCIFVWFWALNSKPIYFIVVTYMSSELKHALFAFGFRAQEFKKGWILHWFLSSELNNAIFYLCFWALSSNTLYFTLFFEKTNSGNSFDPRARTCPVRHQSRRNREHSKDTLLEPKVMKSLLGKYKVINTCIHIIHKTLKWSKQY